MLLLVNLKIYACEHPKLKKHLFKNILVYTIYMSTIKKLYDVKVMAAKSQLISAINQFNLDLGDFVLLSRIYDAVPSSTAIIDKAIDSLLLEGFFDDYTFELLDDELFLIREK